MIFNSNFLNNRSLRLFLQGDLKLLNVPFGTLRLYDYALYYSPVEQVLIPNSVLSIGYRCFSNSNLKEIVIGNGVIALGEYCFSPCPNLKSVTFGRALPRISRFCFTGNTALDTVIFSDSIHYIDSAAFQNCNNLTQISLPNSLLEIGSYAFSNCQINDLSLPNSVEQIGIDCFTGNAITNINLSIPNLKLYTKCFSRCYSLTNININSLPIFMSTTGVFYECKNLLTVNIGSNTNPINDVSSIPDNTFELCSLATIHIYNETGTGSQNLFKNKRISGSTYSYLPIIYHKV